MSVYDRFISVNCLRLHYRHWSGSSGQPMVLLHGGCAHAHWWDRFAAEIVDRHEVFALDLRGHGDSAWADPPAYSIERYADDVAGFIEQLRLGAVHLVGHSLGAVIAAAYAGRCRLQLRTLTIVDSQARISASGSRYMKRLHHFPHPLYRSHADAVQRFRLLPTQTNATPETLAELAAESVRQLPDGRWTLKFDRQSLADAEPQDFTAALKDPPCPILLVRGAHSTLLPADKFQALLDSIPRIRGAEIPNAHHHVMLDNPQAFTRIVRAFLMEHGAGRRREEA